MEHKRSIVLFLLVLLTIIETSTGASPPPPSPSNSYTCLAELFACQSDTASTTCCAALKTVYTNEKDCLCLVVNSETTVGQLGLNGTQVSDLLVQCDIAKNATDICGAAPPLPFSPGTPLPFLTPPGGVLPAPPPPNDASVPHKSMWIWLSGFASALLFMFFGY